MSRYIDFYLIGELVSHGNVHYEDLKKLPTADVVEVVRCRDCINWEFRDGWDHCRFFDWLLEDDNGYCHFGERREDEKGRNTTSV